MFEGEIGYAILKKSAVSYEIVNFTIIGFSEK